MGRSSTTSLVLGSALGLGAAAAAAMFLAPNATAKALQQRWPQALKSVQSRLFGVKAVKLERVAAAGKGADCKGTKSVWCRGRSIIAYLAVQSQHRPFGSILVLMMCARLQL